jgi:hypothetical protein
VLLLCTQERKRQLVASALSEGREGAGGGGNKLSMDDLRFLFLGGTPSSNSGGVANGSGKAGAGAAAKSNGKPNVAAPAEGDTNGSTAAGSGGTSEPEPNTLNTQ